MAMADTRSVDIPTDTPVYKCWADDGDWTVDQNWTWHFAYEWLVNVTEPFGLTLTLLNKDPQTILHDSFAVSDKSVWDFGLNKYESVNLAESLTPALSFVRDFYEILDIQPVEGNTMELPFAEKMAFYDALVRGAQGVVSDICFETGTWTMDLMEEAMHKGKHVGYENFKPFIYGDYTYDKALFRTVLVAESKDRAVLEQFQITVDVPDLTDRGAAEVIDKNYDLQVDFNKNFHVAPEVSVTMRAGTSGEPIAPNITEITEEYFKVHLINAITGEKTVGRFVWTAAGY